MSDINAAPSSTEPATAGDNVNATEVQTRAQEAGTAAVGESVLNGGGSSAQLSTSDSSATLSIAPSTSSTEDSAASSSGATSTGYSQPSASTLANSADAPAVAASGEASAADAQPSALVPRGPDALSAQPVSDAQASAVSGDAAHGDDPNAGASPAAGQSASGTASSVQVASQEGGIAVGTWPNKTNFITHEELIAMRVELPAARARIAELEQQLNAATAAKPHATSLLQKLEAGEAIVLGDLQSRLRAFVDAL